MGRPNLSGYLVEVLQQYPALERQMRGVLPNSYVHEGALDSAVAAYDGNIQQYPNSELERTGLYGKFLIVLYNQRDVSAATSLHAQLSSGYPSGSETYVARIQLANYQGLQSGSSAGGSQTRIRSASVKQSTVLPTEFALDQNYPNPFNPATVIRYALPKESTVKLSIFNMLGQEVATLLNGTQAAGYYEVVWDGRGNSGEVIAGGIYFYRIHATPTDGSAAFTEMRKMVMLK